MPSKSLSIKRSKISAYVMFVAPSLIIYLAVMGYPVLFSIFLSFTDYNVYKNTFVMVGLKHFINMFNDPVFWMSLKNNFLIIAVSVFGQIPIGFVLAYVLYRKLVKYQRLFQSAIFMPIVISSVIVGVLWSSFFSPYGAFTSLMKRFYGPDYINQVFVDPKIAMIPILFVILWIYTGMYLIIFIANMRRIDESIIEAALVDGATEKQIFMKIILPSLSGVVLTSLILAISGSLKSFDLIFAMTQGGPAHCTSILSIYMYENSFRRYDYSFGSAISSVLVIISFVLIGITSMTNRLFNGPDES